MAKCSRLYTAGQVKATLAYPASARLQNLRDEQEVMKKIKNAQIFNWMKASICEVDFIWNSIDLLSWFNFRLLLSGFVQHHLAFECQF